MHSVWTIFKALLLSPARQGAFDLIHTYEKEPIIWASWASWPLGRDSVSLRGAIHHLMAFWRRLRSASRIAEPLPTRRRESQQTEPPNGGFYFVWLMADPLASRRVQVVV